MIQAEDLQKGYGGDAILEGVSFTMGRRERLGLVGRNGSGKTTLLRLITGEETADGGKLHFPKGYRIGYLNQHIRFTEPTLIEEAALGLPPEERDQLYRVETLLFGLGFSEKDLEKSPDAFSGGYQLRLHLTKVLVSEPDCLLLDEPTNYLDVVSIRWLTRFLSQWQSELVVISHDRNFMDAITTHTMAIHRKRTVKVKGGTKEVYDLIVQREETHEKQRQKIERQKSHLEDYVRRFGAKASKAKQAQSKAKAASRLPSLEKLAAIEDLDFQFNASPMTGRRVLEAKDLCFTYPEMEDIPEGKSLIDHFDLSLENGEGLAIIGKNGRGKSTLLHLLAGELEANSGNVKRWDNVKIGFFGQKGIEKLHPNHTVEDEIQISNPQLNTTEVRRICGMMMFTGDHAAKKIRVLSGGEKSRVLLGKILASECNLLLLDEPTNHLDMESIEALTTAIEHFPGTFILVTHNEGLLHRLPSRLIVCRECNQQVFQGDYQMFLEKIGWDEVASGSGRQSSPKGMDKKERKQKRAELVQERSQTLRPIRKDMEKLEKEIIQLEEKIESGNSKLLDATQNGDNDSIANLTKEIGQAQKKVESLFEQLDTLSQRATAVEQAFQQQLDQTS